MDSGQKYSRSDSLNAVSLLFFCPLSYIRGLAAARCSAGAVFLVFFFFAHIVFPLVLAFMLFPACAVACTKVKPVRITNAVSVVDQFSAGIPAEEKHAIVIVESFPYRVTTDMPCVGFPAFEAAIVAFSALSIKHVPNRVSRG